MTRFRTYLLAFLVLLGVALWLPGALEWTCYALLLGWLASRPMLRTVLCRLGLPQRLFASAFVIALLAGQLLQQEANTYPLVAWAMFTKPVAGDPDYYEYLGVRADGSEVELRLREDLFPTPLGQNLMVCLGRLARSMAQAESTDATQTARYEAIVRALAHKYNQLHPDLPVHCVRVWRCGIPVRDYRGPSSIRRQWFRTILLG